MRLIPTRAAAERLALSRTVRIEPRQIADDQWLIGFRRIVRGGCFLATNAANLRSVILWGGGITLAHIVLRICHLRGQPPSPYLIECWTDRRVLGSMNDMYRMIAATADEAGTVDVEAAERLINESPFAYLGMRCPSDIAFEAAAPPA